MTTKTKKKVRKRKQMKIGDRNFTDGLSKPVQIAARMGGTSPFAFLKKPKTKDTKVLEIRSSPRHASPYGLSFYAYFGKDGWRYDNDGPIYGDSSWLRDFKSGLVDLGVSRIAADKVDYTEQGMQGDDYVSLEGPMDVGLTLWPKAKWALINPKAKLKVGDIVRHTGAHLRSIGMVTGPKDGIIIAPGALTRDDSKFWMVVWSDDSYPEARMISEVAIEKVPGSKAWPSNTAEESVVRDLLRENKMDGGTKSNPNVGHHRFFVGDEVTPRHPTRDGLTHGRIVEIHRDVRGWYYEIEWPELGSTGGGWRDNDLDAFHPGMRRKVYGGVRRKTKRNGAEFGFTVRSIKNNRQFPNGTLEGEFKHLEDAKSYAKQMADYLGLPLVIVLDPEGKVVEMFGARSR